MRRLSLLTALRRASIVAGLALAGCHSSGDDVREAKATDVPQSLSGGKQVAAVENQYATPVKDRVATLGLLNKRNNEEQDLVMKTGESRRVGNVVVKLATCEKTAPWEHPPETGAFVQLFVEERATTAQKLQWNKVFSGWLFKNSPSLNAVEHPVYDVWVKDCAMKFPGEEEDPAASSKPAKATGKGKGTTEPAKPAAAPETPAAPAAPVNEADAGEAPAGH